ncbi:MAG: DUF3810 domain-containing protein [Lachnospiraceae bacterium]
MSRKKNMWEARREKEQKRQEKASRDWRSSNKQQIVQKRRRYILWGVLLLLTIVLNVVAWISKGFCDWYTTHLFPVWENTFGRIMSLIPFTVGEMLLYLLVFAIIVGLFLLILFAVFFYDTRIRHVAKCWWNGIAWAFNILLLLQTLNGSILYHCTGISANVDGEIDQKQEKLFALYNHVAESANALSDQFERDENGFLTVNRELFDETAHRAMTGISHAYPQLSGYYPQVKPMLASSGMCQKDLKSVYLGFSMEAAYNTRMYVVNEPYAICRGLAYAKGYMREDEVDFLAYVACVQSPDPFFKYSGYVSMIDVIAEEIQETCGWSKEVQAKLTKLNTQVQTDNIFLTQQMWDEVNDKRLFNTERMQKMFRTFSNGFLYLEGVKNGMDTKEADVNLLLDHYEKRESYVE